MAGGGCGMELCCEHMDGMTTTVAVPTTTYQLTVTPAAWSAERGWHGGQPAVTSYPTRSALLKALRDEQGVPVGSIRHASRYSYQGWRWEWAEVTEMEPLPRHVVKLAYSIYQQMTAHYEAYLDACESDRRAGHAPHHCEHGTDLWTDYDNICGPCEDGYSLRNRLTRWQLAKEQAHTRHTMAKAVLAWGTEALKHGMASELLVLETIARYQELMGV